MKTQFLILVFLFSYFVAFSQSNKAFESDKIFWYGLDFSQAKFVGTFTQVGDAGVKDGEDLKNQYFPGWNMVIAKEREKYDLRGTFKKADVVYNLDVTDKVNKATDTKEIFSLNESAATHMTEAKVASMIKKYNTGADKGVGLVFLVESFNKFAEEANYYVTFFDIETKKVLYTKKMTGKAGGIGLRNYWARSAYNVLKEAKSAYPGWKK